MNSVNTSSLTKSQVLAALRAAQATPFTPERPTGCGRAYVIVSGDRATINAVAAGCKTLGLMFLRKAYGTSGNAIYMGYDNADGRALAKAKAFATTLKAHGLRAYDDAVGD